MRLVFFLTVLASQVYICLSNDNLVEMSELQQVQNEDINALLEERMRSKYHLKTIMTLELCMAAVLAAIFFIKYRSICGRFCPRRERSPILPSEIDQLL